MYLWEEIMVSIGVALEIFSVAMIKGANQEQLPTHMFLGISLFCGVTQTILIILGMLVVFLPAQYIHNKELLILNRWIAAVILTAIGIRVLERTNEKKQVEEHREGRFSYKEMTILAFQSGRIVLLFGMVLALFDAMITGIWLVFILLSLATGGGLWLGERFGNCHKLFMDGLSGVILLSVGLRIAAEFLEMI